MERGDETPRFARIDRDNVYDPMALQVHAHELEAIPPNPDWIAEALVHEESSTFGVFAETSAVGLVTLLDPRLVVSEEYLPHLRPDLLYLWRLMIDREHRDRGYGSATVKRAVQYAAEIGLSGVNLVTMETASHSATKFDEALKFRRTGRVFDDEAEFVRCKPSACLS